MLGENYNHLSSNAIYVYFIDRLYHAKKAKKNLQYSKTRTSRQVEQICRSLRSISLNNSNFFLSLRAFSIEFELFDQNSNILPFSNRAFDFWKHKISVMNSNKPFLVLCERRMVSIKRKLNNKPVGIKSKALKDLEKGMTNKDVAAK